MPNSLDVLGYGAPIMDLILRVPREFLDTIPGELHGMEHVSFSEMQKIIDASGQVAVPVPGGSASNMIRGLAQFGTSCAIVGKVGDDDFGRKYIQALKENNVTPHLLHSPTPTSTVLSLVEPDGHRTMRTFLGASEELQPGDLPPSLFAHTRHVHIEGYALFNMPTLLQTLSLAKEYKCTISLDLASFEVVRKFKKDLLDILPQYIDVLFANELEAHELTGQDPSSAIKHLSTLCPTTIVMCGKDGCYAQSPTTSHQQNAFLVNDPVDTTGAGDLFAAGFIHAHLQNRPLAECTRIASHTAATVIQVLGAVIPANLWPPLLSLCEGSSAPSRSPARGEVRPRTPQSTRRKVNHR